jgi:predicted small lipoprotein YifL
VKAEPFLLIATLALAGCGEKAPAPAPSAPQSAPQPAAAATPATYVGRWAATADLCANGAWVFAERSLTTAGETGCEFDKVTSTSTGYEIAARCRAQAPEQPHTLILTLTDPAPPEAMTAAGGPWSGSVTLMRCPAPAG